jgi:dienelactone hydrolase
MLAYTGADLDAVITFHAALPTPSAEQAKAIKPTIVICHGALDSFISDQAIHEFRKALDEAGVDYEFDIYAKSKHSFTVPDADSHGNPGMSYNKLADKRSWSRLQRLFAEKLGTPKS